MQKNSLVANYESEIPRCSNAKFQGDAVQRTSKAKTMNDPSVKMGTIGGIFFNFFVLPWMDIEKTIMLSATGAVVSFLISLFLRRITKSKKDL